MTIGAMKPEFIVLSAATLLAAGCVTTKPFDARAWSPRDSKAVVVKVSLNTKNAYVLEGNRVLLATPVTIGTPEHPTPKGGFKVFQKIADKRSSTYGFHVGEGTIRPGVVSETPKGWRYVGFPMAYWVEFAPGYGFHAGGVWPQPRSHGCLRVHPTVAPKLFALCQVGTPVTIADSLPEDATIGKAVTRPTDYADPDPPAAQLISDAAFSSLPKAAFEAEPAPMIQ